MSYVSSKVAYNAILRKCNAALNKPWTNTDRRFVDVDAFLEQDIEKVYWDFRKAGLKVYWVQQPDPNNKVTDWGVKRRRKHFLEFHPPSKDKEKRKGKRENLS